jgi:hypothetical protein
MAANRSFARLYSNASQNRIQESAEHHSTSNKLYVATEGPRECVICFEQGDTRVFLDYNLGAKCQHPVPKICTFCYELYFLNTMKYQCIYDTCSEEISLEDVLYLATSASNRLRLQRRHPRWIDCTVRNCVGGCIAPSMDAIEVWCTTCHSQACFQCRTSWHERETCGEYQYRKAEYKAQVESRMGTEYNDYIQKNMHNGEAKRCPGPNCDVLLEKTGGCDHMTCTICP